MEGTYRLDTTTEITPDRDILDTALAVQSKHWPDVRTEVGAAGEGWTTAKAFFEDDDAISTLLEHEQSLNEDTDAKASAAFLMTDYCHIFTAAAVPLLAGFDIVPDLSPDNFALNFYMEKHEHKGRIYDLPRAHVRYLSGRFSRLPDQSQSCDLFRTSTEAHFQPLIETLSQRSGLSRNALWRLLADALAARFLEAGRQLGCLDKARIMAMAVLKQPRSPLANKQMHYFDLTVLDREERPVSYTFRARGGCCRFYSVKGGKYCTTCVLKDPHERDEQLQQAMRRYLGVTADAAAAIPHLREPS